jgi:hypothetical protein
MEPLRRTKRSAKESVESSSDSEIRMNVDTSTSWLEFPNPRSIVGIKKGSSCNQSSLLSGFQELFQSRINVIPRGQERFRCDGQNHPVPLNDIFPTDMPTELAFLRIPTEYDSSFRHLRLDLLQFNFNVTLKSVSELFWHEGQLHWHNLVLLASI